MYEESSNLAQHARKRKRKKREKSSAKEYITQFVHCSILSRLCCDPLTKQKTSISLAQSSKPCPVLGVFCNTCTTWRRYPLKFLPHALQHWFNLHGIRFCICMDTLSAMGAEPCLSSSLSPLLSSKSRPGPFFLISCMSGSGVPSRLYRFLLISLAPSWSRIVYFSSFLFRVVRVGRVSIAKIRSAYFW